MPRRRCRVLHHRTVEQAMQAAQEMCDAAVRVRTEAPIGGPAYVAAGDVLKALDGLAEALTGKERVLHTRPHTAGG